MASLNRGVVAWSVSLLLGCNGDSGTSSASATDSSTGTVGTTGGPPASSSSTGEVPEPTTDPTTSGSASATQSTGQVTSSSGDSETDATTDAATGSTTDTGSTGVPEPFCGDGNVDPSEECDDANADNTDTCVEGCKSAACGDGFVGPGETCDDGNQVDGDACGNDCAPASCGDGKLQPGEACDDGNKIDTDACLGTCAAASCGDGFIQAGTESCDDGNADETDACTSLCAAPSCMDKLKSGSETDIDCGGASCPDCELAQACAVPADCKSGGCDGGICVLAPSCKALKAAQPNTPDGVQDLDPDGAGPVQPFKAYCDMTTDGGGWTLAMRFAPSMAQFHFYSTHWTSVSLVNDNVTSPTDPSDGKFQAYNALPGGEIRGCQQHPVTKAYACKAYALPQMTTLLTLFKDTPVGSDIAMKALYFVETQAEKLKWLTNQGRTLADASVPNPNYVAVGINIDDDQSCYDARVRFGLVLNNEADISTLNDAAGFGAQAYYTAGCDLAQGVDSPWRTASGFQAGSTSYNTAGQIWVR